MGIAQENIKLRGYEAAGGINPVGIYVWDTGTLSWIKQGPITGGGGGGAVTIADGADVAEGATTDAAVITDSAGTVSGKLRGLVKWAFERMPASLGQKAMAASLPVAIASDQSAVPVSAAQSGAWNVSAAQSGAWTVAVSGTVPISAASLPLPTGAATEATLATRATEATLATRLSEADFDTKIGSLTEAAPATDTASSGLNGRLQRIAQRLTSLIALLPAALVGGRLDTNTGSWLGSVAPTVGQKTMANSLPVVIASDQTPVLTDERAATLTIVVTGGANAIATATLPAVAGQFHYITHISLKRVATAALAGGALLTVTTTNLGGRAWRTGNQMSITVSSSDPPQLLDQEYVHPLKSAVANTATTIVGPAAGAAVSWQIVVDYFTAP